MEEKNQMVVGYINSLREQFAKNNIPITDSSVDKVINQYTNSSKSFDVIKQELDKLVEEKLEELRKRQEFFKRGQQQSEKHYDLNDLFDCRISNNTLHIHVVPKSIEEDIKKVGLRNYFKIVEEKLEDAFKKIPNILNDPSNRDVQSVFAVSPLLKVSMAQEIFRNFGFDVEMSDNPIFQEMFDGKRIGQAKMSKEKFMQLYSDLKQDSINFQQDFNYHTHTKRCGHAGVNEDREYVLEVRKNGITSLGFSDHVPYTELEQPKEEQRMFYSQVEEYLSSIKSLKQEFPDMTILAGFEAEFDPSKEQFLGALRDKCDYMILGQHFINGVAEKNNPNYPIEYAKMVCRGIDSGIFDIVAHPDLFMQFRDSIETEEDKRLFEQNSIIASQMICDRAKEMGIPIEINFGGIDQMLVQNDGELSYPHSLFWNIAQESGVQVLYGIDTHNPEMISKTGEYLDANRLIVDSSKLNMTPNGYNPVVARQNNSRLQQAYERGQANALTYETHLITQIVNNGLSRMPQDVDSESIAYGMGMVFESVSNDCTEKATKMDESTIGNIEKIADDKTLTAEEKKFKMERSKALVSETNQVLTNQQSAIQRGQNSVQTAIGMGCEKKEEISNAVTQITEHQTTKNEAHKQQIEQSMGAMQRTKMNNGGGMEQQKGTPLVLKPNTNHNSGNGFVNVITLSLLVTFVLGVAVGIGYMIYRIMLGG